MAEQESDKAKKLDWIPLYIQRLKASNAWTMPDYQFGWYIKLLVESADSPLPGYLPGSLDKLWQIAGAKSQSYFEKWGGCELVSRLFRRTEISGQTWIYNDRMLQTIYEQNKKLSHKHRKRSASLSLSLQEFPSYISGEIFQEFVKMREMKKKPMTPYAMKLTIDKLGRLKEQGHDPNKILEVAIANCWTGVWPIDESLNGNGNGNSAHVGAHTQDKENAFQKAWVKAGKPNLSDDKCPKCSGSGWQKVGQDIRECACRIKAIESFKREFITA